MATCSVRPTSSASLRPASAKATSTTWRSRRRHRITDRNRRRLAREAASVERSTPTLDTPPRNVRLLACSALAALVVLLYVNSFQSQFVFDNRVIVLDDPRLRDVSAANLRDIFTHTYWWPSLETPLYRPITTLTYLFNYTVLGHAERPAGYHAVNLLLHVANVFLLLAIVRRLGVAFWLAIAVAALWAAHPLLTEAVTNIVGRADLLAAFGILASLYCHQRARTADNRQALGWRAALLASATVAMFSKETGAVVPALLVAHDLLRRDGRRRLDEDAADWIVACVPLALFFAARTVVIAGPGGSFVPFVDNPIAGAGFWQARLTAVALLARYLHLFLWPVTLSPDYSFAQIGLISGTVHDWAAWTIVAVVAVIAILSARRFPLVSFALAAAFLALLPASNLLFASGTVMAERLMYLPAAGLAAAAVAALHWLSIRANWKPLTLMVCGLVVAGYSAGTLSRNRDWRDELTLWSAAREAVPLSFKAHSAYAEALYQSDPTHANLDRVLEAKEQSLAILDRSPDPAQTIKPYHEAAAYALERGDWLQTNGGSPQDIRTAYERAAIHERRYLSLLVAARQYPNPPTARDESDAYLLLATATAHLDAGAEALTAARAGRDRQPFNPAVYQTEAAALIGAKRMDDAGVVLMTGFMVTGAGGLRDALIELYRSGLDTENCAATRSASGIVLNQGCAIVHRHLCAASANAFGIYERTNQPVLADQARQNAITQFACAQS